MKELVFLFGVFLFACIKAQPGFHRDDDEPRCNGGAKAGDCGTHEAKRPRSGENRSRVNERIRGTLPFPLGNGASKTIVRDITHSDEEDVDRSLPAAASLPKPENQQSRTPMGSGAVAAANAGTTPPSIIPSLPSERAYAPPNHPLPAQPPSHASTPHGALPPHFVNGYLGGGMQLARNSNPPHVPQAPLSTPSPRCIDDTHLFWDLNEISSFAPPPSVSETARGRHDRNVPSGSSSIADDTDLSLFDSDGNEETDEIQ